MATMMSPQASTHKRRILEGVTDADILSFSITASAQKRKLKSQPITSTPEKRGSFDLRKGGRLREDKENSPLAINVYPLDEDVKKRRAKKAMAVSGVEVSPHSLLPARSPVPSPSPLLQVTSSVEEHVVTEEELLVDEPLPPPATEPEVSQEVALQPSPSPSPSPSLVLEGSSVSDTVTTTAISSSVTSKIDLKNALRQRICDSIKYQIEDILNHGSMSELVKLKAIGKTRAERILDMRADGVHVTMNDLEEIGMTSKAIKKFFITNSTMFLQGDLE